MENLKIRVNSEAERKEAQELFFELGYGRNNGKTKEVCDIDFDFLFAYGDDLDLTHTNDEKLFKRKNHKQITLPELRALVFLKRNDVGGATHTDRNNCLWFVGFKSYFWNGDKWTYYHSVDSEKLKPIEKPMKEYLRRNVGGTYSYVGTVHPDHVHDLLIEIPEGAEIALKGERHIIFRRFNNGVCEVAFDDSTHWVESVYSDLNGGGSPVIWQRHTQPEELPFVDDEPSLNDQYAEIEQVRQASITDTLNERQSQYGGFKDVADTTAVFMDQFALGRMSSVQREALHMICSKLARIAHGDPNHKDSWHDIAGYATLVERTL